MLRYGDMQIRRVVTMAQSGMRKKLRHILRGPGRAFLL